MNLLELVDAVVSITSRPDKRARIATAINKVIWQESIKADWFDDHVDSSLALNPNELGQEVSIATLTRFRKFSYVKVPGERKYLNPTAVDKIFRPGGIIQVNGYCIISGKIIVTLARKATSLEVGYYTYPAPLIANGDSNWMSEKVPYGIIYLAAAEIFADIGDDASNKTYLMDGLSAMNIARMDFADGVLHRAT